MFSEQQAVNSPRRSLSNYKYQFHSNPLRKQPEKKYLFFAKLTKRVINQKIKSHFSMIKNESSKKEKLKKNMIGMEKVVRTNQLRRTFTMLKVVSNTKIKKICGLKIIQIYFNKLVEERQKYSFSMLKCKYFNKTLDKIYSSNFNFLEKIMTKKNRFYKEKGFQRMKDQFKHKTKHINNIKKIINQVEFRRKIQSFLKINFFHFGAKASNFQTQPPTIESQQNIQFIEGLEEEEKKNNFQLLKKSTSDTNINMITYRLKDSLEQKTKRSLSRKSRVSSLMEQDFTNILAGSFSSKDYHNLKYGNSTEKSNYYKKIASSYKKQLDIATSELEIMKELNDNYEVQMQGVGSSSQTKQIMKLNSQIKMLKKDKQKYKQRSKIYGQQIVTMKDQFKNRIETLQMRLKKQF